MSTHPKSEVHARILERFELSKQIRVGKILLVGEQASGKHHNDENDELPSPFCSTYGCSGWITKRLMEANIPESALVWQNAIVDGSSNTLKKTVEQCSPTCIIALGKVASNTLDRLEYAHLIVPHPQYWKRFRSGEEYPLAQQVKNVLLLHPAVI